MDVVTAADYSRSVVREVVKAVLTIFSFSPLKMFYSGLFFFLQNSCHSDVTRFLNFSLYGVRCDKNETCQRKKRRDREEEKKQQNSFSIFLSTKSIAEKQKLRLAN